MNTIELFKRNIEMLKEIDSPQARKITKAYQEAVNALEEKRDREKK